MKVYKNKDFCGFVMSSEKNDILELNKNMKSDKIQYIIYADTEPLTKNIDRCANKKNKHKIW